MIKMTQLKQSVKRQLIWDMLLLLSRKLKEGQEISEEVKAEILKNDKEASTILEETGHIAVLKELEPEKKLKKLLTKTKVAT